MKQREDREKRKIEEKEGLRDPSFFRIFPIRPCNVAIVSSSPQGMKKLELKHQNVVFTRLCYVMV